MSVHTSKPTGASKRLAINVANEAEFLAKTSTPLSLHDPHVFKAFIQPEMVVESDGAGSTVLVNVLHSTSQRSYEVGSYVKKTIYGAVVHGVVLERHMKASRELSRPVFQRTSHEVAIKIFSKEMIVRGLGKAREQPLQEMAMLQFLQNHPHESILGQVECCANEQHLFSIMPWVEGSELFDHVVQHGRMDESSAFHIFSKMLHAVEHLHELRLSHRDLSLENILYNAEDGTVRLIDFGMAQSLFHRPQFSSTSRVAVLDTPNDFSGKKNYLAPEIVQGHASIDPFACDRWALGVILLYLLLGFPPIEHAGVDDPRYVCIVQDGQLDVLVEHWNITGLSPAVLDLVNGLLREDPSQRLAIAEIWAHPWMQAQLELRSASEEVFDDVVEFSQSPVPPSNRKHGTASEPAMEIEDELEEELSEQQQKQHKLQQHNQLHMKHGFDQCVEPQLHFMVGTHRRCCPSSA